MSGADEPGFGLIRKRELDLIKTLPHRSRPRLITLITAMRAEHGGKTQIALSDRDFRDYGLARDAAGCALKDAVAIGLLEIVRPGGLTGRGHKTVYRVPYAQRDTAGKPGTSGGETRPFRGKAAGKPAINGRETPPLSGKAAGKPGTTQETSSTSSQKSKGEEVSSTMEPEAIAGRQSLRESLLRIEQAARSLGLRERVFIERAGGREQADFLARAFDRGSLSPPQMAAKLAAISDGSASEPSVTPAPVAVARATG